MQKEWMMYLRGDEGVHWQGTIAAPNIQTVRSHERAADKIPD